MKFTKVDHINYRISRAEEALKDAKALAEIESWNSCVSRLYYACFYVVSALLLDLDLQPKTHKGMKVNFLNHFIKPGKINKDMGKFYTNLHDWRGESDYADFIDFDGEMVLPLIHETEKFIKEIQSKIKIS